jgi:hypothetical protein
MPEDSDDDRLFYLWSLLGDKAPLAFRPAAKAECACSCEDILIAYMKTLEERDKQLSAALKDKLAFSSFTGTLLGIGAGLIVRELSRR